jgi:hypothetical protein
MKEDNKINLDVLSDLIDVISNADPEEKIYKMNVKTSDTLIENIESKEDISDEKKKKYKEKYSKRLENQKKIQKLSENASDITRAKTILKPLIQDERNKKDINSDDKDKEK